MQKDCLAKFDDIMKSFSSLDRIAVTHDLDADGVSSGALAYLAIKRLRGREPDLLITQRYKTVELLSESLGAMRDAGIGKLVIVDFAADQNKKSLSKAEGIVHEVLLIDHHKDYGFKGKKTFIVKPQFFSRIEPSRYPCAKLVYDLFSRHVDLSSHSWVACAGLMGDNQLRQWQGFVEEAVKKHGTSIAELWKVSESISAVEVLAPEKLHDMVLLIAECSSPRSVLRSPLAGYRQRLAKKVAALFKRFKAEKEVFREAGLVWFSFASKQAIKSALINKVSNELYPNRTVVVVQDKGNGFVDFSARRQDFKVRTNDFVESAVEGLENAGGGGHIPASAGRVMKKDLPEFKKRVISLLESRRFSDY